MIENSLAGLDTARVRGKNGGRPKKLDEKKAASGFANTDEVS